MMTLFSVSRLMDEKKDYERACIGILKKLKHPSRH